MAANGEHLGRPGAFCRCRLDASRALAGSDRNLTASDRARLPSAAATAGTMALGGTRLGAGCWLAGDRATSPAAPPRGSMGSRDLLRPASDWLQTGFRLGTGWLEAP